MAAIEKRLAKLEADRAELLALDTPQVLRVVRLDKIDYNNPPVLVIAPGLLDLLRPNASELVDPALGG